MIGASRINSPAAPRRLFSRARRPMGGIVMARESGNARRGQRGTPGMWCWGFWVLFGAYRVHTWRDGVVRRASLRMFLHAGVRVGVHPCGGRVFVGRAGRVYGASGPRVDTPLHPTFPVIPAIAFLPNFFLSFLERLCLELLADDFLSCFAGVVRR